MHDVQRLINLIGLAAMVLVLVGFFWRHIGPLLSITWGYFLLRTLFVFQNPFIKEINFDVPGGVFKSGVYIDQTSGQAFSQILLIPLSILLLRFEIHRYWREGFIAFGFVNTLLLVTKGFGLMNANSFDAAMLAAMVPLMGLWGIVFFLGILSAKSATTAGLMLIVSSVVPLIMRHYKKPFAWILSAAIVGAISFTVKFNLLGKVTWDNDRPAHWREYMAYWYDNASHLFGFGPGSFQWISPALYKFQGSNLYLQMHNDWLQLLFEGGVIGLGLAVMSYLHLLWVSRDNLPYFSTWLGIGVFCVSYHPLRFFPSALFIAFVAHAICSAHVFKAKNCAA